MECLLNKPSDVKEFACEFFSAPNLRQVVEQHARGRYEEQKM